MSLGTLIIVEHGPELTLKVDLNLADTLVGSYFFRLGVPILEVEGYGPSSDGYRSLRHWYRNLIKEHGLFAIHTSYLEKLLRKIKDLSEDAILEGINSSSEALSYLTAPNEERKSDWNALNEAVCIKDWIFPAHAVNGARVKTGNGPEGLTLDSEVNKITVKIEKGNSPMGEVCYELVSKIPYHRTLSYIGGHTT
ncbi:hypothetical protein KY347_04610 [Candidatus Woesearchaeota archaeon]|nr:hypothetical protein [Candidatus Woesearchaeota archaeon]